MTSEAPECLALNITQERYIEHEQVSSRDIIRGKRSTLSKQLYSTNFYCGYLCYLGS